MDHLDSILYRTKFVLHPSCTGDVYIFVYCVCVYRNCIHTLWLSTVSCRNFLMLILGSMFDCSYDVYRSYKVTLGQDYSALITPLCFTLSMMNVIWYITIHTHSTTRPIIVVMGYMPRNIVCIQSDVENIIIHSKHQNKLKVGGWHPLILLAGIVHIPIDELYSIVFGSLSKFSDWIIVVGRHRRRETTLLLLERQPTH